MTRLARYLPILVWGRSYDRQALSNDLIAAVIVTAPAVVAATLRG